MDKLLRRLPDELIFNIMGYSYQPQPKALLCDIRSFTSDFGLVSDCYYIYYNERILLYDLYEFCKQLDGFNSCLTRFAYLYKKDPPEYINNFYMKYENKSIVYIQRRCRIIWGMLTPTERTRFINNYILLDELLL
jgi:hypothetical protein